MLRNGGWGLTLPLWYWCYLWAARYRSLTHLPGHSIFGSEKLLVMAISPLDQPGFQRMSFPNMVARMKYRETVSYQPAFQLASFPNIVVQGACMNIMSNVTSLSPEASVPCNSIASLCFLNSNQAILVPGKM